MYLKNYTTLINLEIYLTKKKMKTLMTTSKTVIMKKKVLKLQSQNIYNY